MSAKRQQGGAYRQLLLFESNTKDALRPEVDGDGGTEATACEEQQPLTATDQARALTRNLMEEVTKASKFDTYRYNIKGNRRIR